MKPLSAINVSAILGNYGALHIRVDGSGLRIASPAFSERSLSRFHNGAPFHDPLLEESPTIRSEPSKLPRTPYLGNLNDCRTSTASDDTAKWIRKHCGVFGE